MNELDRAAAVAALMTCCGSRRWAERVADARPFRDVDTALAIADDIWLACDESDWREAFAAHPRIGERKAEQADAVDAAAPATLAELAELNDRYYERFGYIFIVCAAGKSAAQMLIALRKRIVNEPAIELRIAAEEQRKISRLRLKELLG